MRRAPAIPVVTFFFAIAAVWAAGQQLQPYSSTDGHFTVSFPQGEVKQDTQSVDLKAGGSSSLHEFYVEVDGGNVSYMVMYNDYAADYANDGPDAVLARTRDGAVGSKTLVSDMSINLNGVPGREFTTKDDKWNFTVRQYLSGKRLYQLIVVSSTDHPAALTSDFLNSFKIL